MARERLTAWWPQGRPCRLDHVGAVCRVVTILGFVAASTIGCTGRDGPTSTQRVVLAGQVFLLELALDQQARFQGLSDRSQIAPNGGMLFVFPRAQVVEFVMRRCPVPIDVIFLDPGGRVVATHAMRVDPPDTPEQQLTRYPSYYPAQFAIEIRGGSLNRLQLRPGQKIGLPLQALKQRAR